MPAWTRTLFVLVLAGFGLPPIVFAQSSAARLVQWDVEAIGSDARITIAGSWPDSCNPGPPAVVRDGRVIRLHMRGGASPDVLCFSAIRPWRYSVVVSGLATGAYDVKVSYEFRAAPGAQYEMGGFSFDYPLAPSGNPAVQGVPLGEPLWLLFASVLLLLIARYHLRRGQRTF